MGNGAFTLRIVAGAEGLASIREPWERLTGALSRPRFFHFAEFYEAYAAANAGGAADARFAVLEEGGQVRAIFPFKTAVLRVLGVPMRTLEFPAPWDMAADLVCLRDGREGEYLSELFRALGSVPGLRWDFAWLARVLDDSCAHSLLTASPRPAALRQSAGAAAYLDLVPYDQQLARFSKGFRRNLRKQRNHLQRLGPVEFVCVDSGPALDEAFEVFLDLEAAGWKGREGTAIRRLGPEAESFYREIARRLGRRSACEIYLLKAAGRVIGAQLCYLAADTCYMIKVAYDEHYEECSPGQTVIQHILERYGTRPPFSVVSFCSDEAWLRDLRPKAENVHELRVFNRTPGGTAARVLCRLKALAMGLGLRRRISGGNPLPPPPRQAPPEG